MNKTLNVLKIILKDHDEKTILMIYKFVHQSNEALTIKELKQLANFWKVSNV